MTPRLKNSKKWTAFPPDFNEQIREAFTETFVNEMKKGELIIEGRIYPGEILLRVGYLEKGGLRQNNFEVSVDYKQDQAVDRIQDAIDAAASMMADFFDAEGDIDFPRDWKEYDFENQKVYCQYTTVNSKLEAEADKLLGVTDENLVKGSDDDENEEGDPDPESPPSDKNKLH